MISQHGIMALGLDIFSLANIIYFQSLQLKQEMDSYTYWLLFIMHDLRLSHGMF